MNKLLASVLIAAGLATATHAAPAQEISIGYLPITDHLTVLAKSQCKFEHADLKLVKFGSWPELAEALKSGAVDGAFALSPIALNLRLKGAPLKAVLLGHRNGSVITVKADGPVRKPADLRGKTIAIPSRFSTHNILLNKLLAKEGLDPAKDVKIIELAPPEMVSSLATGRIDAYIVAEPFGGQAEKQKIGRVLALSKDIWHDHICCVLNLNEKFIAEHPEAVQELVDNFVKTAHFIKKNPKKAAEESKQFLGQSPEVIEHVLTKPKGRVTYDDLVPRTEDFAATQDALVELGIFKEKVNLEAYLDPSFAKKAYAKGK